jgi:hypothetical protein
MFLKFLYLRYNLINLKHIYVKVPKHNWLFLALLVISTSLFGQAPIITSFTPTSGPVGTVVTITGSNFNPVAANNVVFFGGVQASVISSSATSLTVVAPTGATAQPISELNLNNNLSGISSNPFAVTFAATRGITTSEFETKQFLPSAASSGHVNVVDIDGDGKLDVIVNNNINTLSVYRNIAVSGVLSTNSFAPGVNIFNSNLFDATISDMDGDGKKDIILSEVGGFSFLKNLSTPGTIAFGSPIFFSTISIPYGILISDVDADGKPDVVLTTYNAGKYTLSIFRNTASGSIINNTSFTSKTDISTSTAAAFTMGDLNGDSKPDVILIDGTRNVMSIMRNITTSTSIAFDAKVDFMTGNLPQYVGVSDLDNDGKPDITVVNANSNTVSVYRNTSQNGAFTSSSLAAKVDFATGSRPSSLNIADVNGDGRPEILTGNVGVMNGSNGTISILRNLTNTSGITTSSFDMKVDFEASLQSNSNVSIFIGDIDGDSKPDLLIGNGNVWGYRNNPQYAPVISNITPGFGAIGSTATITGNNFNILASKNSVYFGQTKALVNSASTTQLTVTIPVSASYEPYSVYNADSRLSAYANNVFVPTFNSKHTISAADFDPKVNLATLNLVSAVNFMDLDGDGKPDMVITNNNNVASIYRNISVSGSISASSFASKVDLNTGGNSSKIIFKDVNGDGKPDILVLNTYNSNISCFLNQTTQGVINASSFANVSSISSVGDPVDVSFTDMDGDGKPDYIAGNTTSGFGNSFTISHNISAGSTIAFFDNDKYNTSKLVYTVLTGDINGDGKPDLITVNSDNTISVFQNNSVNGNIILGSEITLPIAIPVNTTIKLADIDGDGNLDIIVCNVKNLKTNVLSFYRNTAATGNITISSFSARQDFAIGKSTSDFIIADMDGDGKPDILIDDSNYGLSILLNGSAPGNISFSAKADLMTGLVGTGLFLNVCDVDGDGKPDIIFQDSNNNYNSVIAAYHFNPVLATALQVPPVITSISPGAGPSGSSIIVNGYNFNSTATSNVAYFGTAPATVIAATSTQLKMQAPVNGTFLPLSVLNKTNNLAGFSLSPFVNTFNSSGSHVLTASPFNFQTTLSNIGFSADASAIGDLDGDGKLDIVVINHPGNNHVISVFTNSSTTGNFSFGNPMNYPIVDYTGKVILSDVDGDGKLDIIVSTVSVYQSPLTLSVFLNTSAVGKTSFATPLNIVVPGYYTTPGNIAVGDINGDGKPDIISLTNTADIYLNTSAPGKIAYAAPIEFGMEGTGDLSVNDIDGDGKLDLLIAVSGKNKVSVFKNIGLNGGVAFAAGVDFAVGNASSILKAGDIDGDGKVDIVVASPTDKVISILRNISTSSVIAFQSSVDLTVASLTTDLVLGDVDGDGKIDLTATSFSSSKFFVKQNKSTPGNLAFGNDLDVVIPNGPNFLSMGDLDGDGKPDLVMSIQGTQAVYLYRNDASPLFTLQANNFTVSNTSLSCKGTHSGVINIAAAQNFAYTATLTGPGTGTVPFTTNAAFNNLAAGTYNVCITVAGQPTFQQCFTVALTEPKDLSLYSVVSPDNKSLTLSLSGGSVYNIQINGSLRTTTDSIITLQLATGKNELTVTTDKPCQGIIQKTILASDIIIPYPDPFDNVLNLSIGSRKVNKAVVEIFTSTGSLIYKNQFNNPPNVIQLDLSSIVATGNYTLKLTNDGKQQVFKVIKK